MIHVGYNLQISFSLSFLSVPYTAIFHHFSLSLLPLLLSSSYLSIYLSTAVLVAGTSEIACSSYENSEKTNTTETTKRQNERTKEWKEMERTKERKSFVFWAEEIFPRDKF